MINSSKQSNHQTNEMEHWNVGEEFNIGWSETAFLRRRHLSRDRNLWKQAGLVMIWGRTCQGRTASAKTLGSVEANQKAADLAYELES